VSSLHRHAAIIGVYTTEQAVCLLRSSASLQLEAVRSALAEAGQPARLLDGLVPLDPSPWGTVPSGHMYWAEQLGERPQTFLELGSAVGGVAKAAAAVSAGLCRLVAVFWSRTSDPGGPTADWTASATDDLILGSPPVHGGDPLAMRALWTRRYMHEFKVTSEDLARVAVDQRHKATLKPDSIMGRLGELTVDAVLAFGLLRDPLHVLDCPGENDGGYAILVASAEIAADSETTPVWVLGGAEASGPSLYAAGPDRVPLTDGPVRASADRAFLAAGVGRDEVDVVGVWDDSTATVLNTVELMGFCGPGEGAQYSRDGHLSLGGSLPANTDGGMLSNSNCGESSGLHLIEVVRQLRDECGARQVPGARIGAVQAQGYGTHTHAATLVLAAD
jgi:acetyl-CoA C-acetyltransferase